MVASSIFFNGRLISVPGSYSTVDTSGLEQVGLGAAGIVAVIGTAVGGQPCQTMTDPSQFIRLTQPSQGLAMFQSGDLREAVNMLFAPSNDPDILAGAQSVVVMKVNNATQSVASFASTSGDSIDFKSADYGAFTSQISINIANGSTQGKMLTITYEDQVETVDNLGGTAAFQLTYTGGANGYTAMTAGVETDGSVHATGTLAHIGMSGDITATLGAASILTVTATSADAGKSIMLFGNVGGIATREVLVLINGSVTSVNSFTKLYGANLSAAAAGTVTVASSTPTTLITFAATAQYKGVFPLSYVFVNNATFTVKASASSTNVIYVEGKNAAGTFVRELITLNGTTPVTSAGSYSMLSALALGDPASSLTITFVAQAARAVAATQQTLQNANAYFDAKSTVVGGTTYGFNWTTVTTSVQQPLSQVDATTADVSILSPANPGFNADLYAIVNWVNTNSQLVNATAASGAIGPPSNTSNPVFLTGGTEGSPVFSDYQAALNLLKQVRVNTIVALTCDPAVSAAIDAHCVYMCGIGRSERDGFVGIQNGGLTDVPTKAQYKSAIQSYNSKNLRGIGQAISRYNTAGTLQEFQPQFGACIGAGMQAGSVVGTSLTHKFASVVSFRQDTSWNPTNDAEEMVEGGALFLEQVDGVGIRWVRNVTTYLQSNNIAYTEGSVNAAVNYAVYNFRTNLEFAVGKQGFSGTINAVKGLAITTLGLLVDTGVITNWQKLAINLVVDVLEVSVEIAPVIPINFVQSTIHLVTVPQSAQAA